MGNTQRMDPASYTGALAPRDTWTPAQVTISDIPEPARTRRTSDLFKLVGSSVAIALLLFAASIQSETTAGIQQDISTAVRTLPSIVVSALATLSSFVFLALPAFLVADLAFRRRWRLMLISVISGGVALVVSTVLNNTAQHVMGERLYDALTIPVGSAGSTTTVTFWIFAASVALVTTQGSAVRARTSLVLWTTLAGLALLFLVDQRATLFALLLSVLGGQAIGFLVRYIAGTDNPRVSSLAIAEALARVGTPPLRLTQLEEDDEFGRRYRADLLDRSGEPTDAIVHVIDPDRGAVRMLQQIRRIVRVRGWVTRAPSFSPRLQVQQSAVPVLMAREAGVRTPRTMSAAQVDDSTILFAEEHPERLRPLDDFDAAAISDDAIEQAWRQVRRLHHAGVSHEGLNPSSLAVDDDGRIWLLNLMQGEIAASRLRMRLDRAELLLATSFLVGIDRAVRIAKSEIGPEDLANLPSLLQPVALNQANRDLLKANRGHLERLVEDAAEQAPAPSQGPVRLERLRLRTVVSLIAVTFAVYVLAGQLSNVNFGAVLRDVSWGWAAAATVASLITYVGAALTVAPLSPVQVAPGRWLAAQFASEFVRLVAPAAVGSAGTNARVIQKAGVPAPLALASVGVSTIVTFVTTVIAFIVVTLLSSADTGYKVKAPSGDVWIIVGVLVGVIVIAFIVPATRRMIINRIKPTWADFGPRLLEVMRDPRRLGVSVGGSLLTSLGYAVTLYASVRAYGEDIPIGAAVAVYLGAGILGTVAPTPGGIGAVEAALVAGLSAVGVPSSSALLAALLYRLVTFWLPTLPGWLSFQFLQSRNAI